MMREKVIKYPGRDIVVKFTAERCIHVAECLIGLPEVFDSGRRPWVEPDAANPDKVAEVIIRCPTGSLHFERKDGGPPEVIPQDNSIELSEDRPFFVLGNIKIKSADGTLLLQDTRVAFCRCGASKIKPLCDGRHALIDYEDEGKIHDSGADASETPAETGELDVVLAQNGPLIMKGPVTVWDARGQMGFQGNRVVLCRCGASERKPFCDGRHAEIGFSG